MPAPACAPRRRCSAAPSSSPLPPASSSTSSTPDHQGEPTMTDQLTELVRERYASAALSVLTPEAAPCCADEGEAFGAGLYDADADTLPAAARPASLGCGNPIAVAELHEGERVLDLGSGGGIDVLLSARRVGPSGRVFGLDMTDEMLALAVRNAAGEGATNVESLRGRIEAIPLPAANIDVIISNCVINLSVDKPAVFAEMARVLRPGGRIGISDVVADDDLAPAQRAQRGGLDADGDHPEASEAVEGRAAADGPGGQV